MIMKVKIRILILLTATLFIFVTGCSDSSDSSDTTGGPMTLTINNQTAGYLTGLSFSPVPDTTDCSDLDPDSVTSCSADYNENPGLVSLSGQSQRSIGQLQGGVLATIDTSTSGTVSYDLVLNSLYYSLYIINSSSNEIDGVGFEKTGSSGDTGDYSIFYTFTSAVSIPVPPAASVVYWVGFFQDNSQEIQVYPYDLTGAGPGITTDWTFNPITVNPTSFGSKLAGATCN